MNVQDPARAAPKDAPSDPADPFVGTVLKNTYLVVRKIAEGGMGSVYEGEHVRLKRRVAIKVLLAQYARHPEVIARFSQEAEIVGSLGHPHIVQVFDVDETEKKEPFLVMEYLDGVTLAERLEREPRLPLASVLRIVEHVAAALASTHEKGVVHRDLKPENIFLVRATGEKDFAKVLDFGISKVRTAGPRLTAHNMVIGTPAYMAPEQARAQRDVDHRVDQFALAAMTYEMLAGQSPFPGDDPAEIMTKVIAQDPPPLAEVAPWVPAAVDAVVQRALKKNAADRFANITEFASALEAAASGAGAAVTLPPVPESVVKYQVKVDPPTPAAGRRAASEQPTLPRSEPPDEPSAKSRESRPPTGSEDRPSAPYHERPGSSPPRSKLIESARVPPQPSPEHRVERLSPLDRQTPSPPMSRPRTQSPISQPYRPRTAPAIERVEPSSEPHSVDRVEHIPSRPPSQPPPPSRPPGRPPSADLPIVQKAEQLADEARNAFRSKRFDDAVLFAEQLLELAVFGNDAKVLDVLRQSMSVVEQIFDARVGPLDAKLEVTEVGRDPKGLNLSPKAAFMLSLASDGLTVQDLIDSCGIPRRDAIRMLAGLIRRGVIVTI